MRSTAAALRLSPWNCEKYEDKTDGTLSWREISELGAAVGKKIDLIDPPFSFLDFLFLVVFFF